jgi:hypothetical protein
MFRRVGTARAVGQTVSLIARRSQQTSSSTGTDVPPSTNTSARPPIDRTNSSQRTTPPPPNTAGTGKAIVYGVALGLGTILLYAEYDNDSFRRKVESTLPLSSTILAGLDKIIDPLFGRHKKLTTIIYEKMPDLTPLTDKLPDQEQIRKTGEKVKDAATMVYNKLPDQKQLERAGEQAKDLINDTYDMLPEYKTVKGKVNHAVDQVS